MQMTTYEIEGKRPGEDLPKITLSSSQDVLGVLAQYIRRYGHASELHVKVLAGNDGKSSAAQETEEISR